MIPQLRSITLVGICLLLAGPIIATATEIAKLAPNDAEPFDRFGAAVAVDGNRIVVGAPWDSDAEDNYLFHGSVYVFELVGSTWMQVAKILPADPEPEAFFGAAVAVDGDRIVVGSPWSTDIDKDHLMAGSAYVFEKNGPDWVQDAKLTPGSYADSQEYFGRSVAVQGDTVSVGAIHDDQTGAVYIFEPGQFFGWLRKARLVPSDGDADDVFGAATAASVNALAVTALGKGSLYVFEGAGASWSEVNIFSDTYDLFGESVTAGAVFIVVGAPGNDHEEPGVVHFFERLGGTWATADTAEAADTSPGDYFGEGIGVFGHLAVVGAPNHTPDQSVDSGAAYVFARDTGGRWIQSDKLLPSDGASGQRFGEAVAIGATSIAVGAPGDPESGSVSGAVYVFGVPLEADFVGYPRSGAPPLEVTFTDLSTGGVTLRQWTFGDGQSTDWIPDLSVEHLYEQEGTYNVTLAVAGPAGEDQIVKLGYISVSESSGPPTIKNGRFEANGDTIIGTGRVDQGNNIDDWVLSDESQTGRNIMGGPYYNNGVTPDQQNVCFIKNEANIRQLVSGFETGETYQLSLAVNARANYPTPKLQVTLGDDVVIGEDGGMPVVPVDPITKHDHDFHTVWADVSPGEGQFYLTISQVRTADASLLIDQVSIEGLTITNGRFEANGDTIIGTGRVDQGNDIDSWELSDESRTGRNIMGGPYYNNGITPDQQNVCFIKMDAYISQLLSGFQAGQTYRISMAVNARANYPTPKLQVTLGDDVVIGEDGGMPIVPVDPITRHDHDFHTVWADVTPGDGDFDLTISQIGSGDASLLIDGVSIESID